MLQEMVLKSPTFFTPSRFTQELAAGSDSPRGRLLIASCRSGAELSHKVALRYKDLLERNGDPCDVLHLANVDLQFSDTETCARLEIDVSGDDVYLFQALLDPTSCRSIDQNYMAFLVSVRTFREWGANYVTGVLRYLAYARQDKPTRFTREPATAKLNVLFQHAQIILSPGKNPGPGPAAPRSPEAKTEGREAKVPSKTVVIVSFHFILNSISKDVSTGCPQPPRCSRIGVAHLLLHPTGVTGSAQASQQCGSFVLRHQPRVCHRGDMEICPGSSQTLNRNKSEKLTHFFGFVS
jgi:hypothetical protein